MSLAHSVRKFFLQQTSGPAAVIIKDTMGQALYRKYRTRTFAETIGQEHVTETLANALKQGKISHAYLFSGPRGTGKTSIARILAHEINGLAYDDEAHLDIIEIDAASNRRIDEIRDLRDRVHTAPVSAKYKVYIIDEVHMLTKEAFNALLKTLEEPPAHVVFILATTEPHKLPETIISRTQRYSLRPVPQAQVIAHLKVIAEGEQITIDDEALALIAQHGEGSFRDSISLLDQAGSAGERITQISVEHILGLAPDTYITQLDSAVTTGDNAAIVTTLAELYAQGFEPPAIAQQLGAQVRQSVLANESNDPAASLQLLAELLNVPTGRNPRQLLEIVLLQAALPTTPTAPIQQVKAAPKAEPVAKPDAQAAPIVPASDTAPSTQTSPRLPTQTPDTQPSVTSDTTAQKAPPPDTPPQTATADAAELWQQALEAIKKQYNTLYGIARMAQPEFDGQRLTLAFKFAFHQKRINEARNRKILSDVIEQLHGQPVEIVCITVAAPSSAGKPNISAISNVFGGAELLES